MAAEVGPVMKPRSGAGRLVRFELSLRQADALCRHLRDVTTADPYLRDAISSVAAAIRRRREARRAPRLERLPIGWLRQDGKPMKACGACPSCWAGRYSRCRDPRSSELVRGEAARHFSGDFPMSEEDAARITRERLGIEGPEEGQRGYVAVDR